MTLVILLTLVVYLTIGVTNCAQTTCSEGTYLQQFDDTRFCVECPAGTFMPWKDHIASTCFECTKIENSTVEILVSPCDRIHDADILCRDGYFRSLARNPRDKPSCLQCRPACPQHFFQVHRCGNFTDLGCCPGENYDFEYYHGNSGPRRCRERPWMCGRGQYLDTTVNDCKPCPGNTFMPEDYHSYTSCWDCHYKSEAELPLHTVITQNCTSTQPARYRCKDGFYMNHGMSYRGDDVGCSPCHSCDEGMYEVRQCDGYHDTVCCHKPNMTVTDMPLGGQCIDKIEELMIYPSVESLQVRQGGCHSIVCYVALTKKKEKPDLTWFGPNVDKDQQFKFEDENYQSGVTVYRNTLTMCNFSTADEGIYHCRDKLSKLNQGMQIHIGVACEYGTYNPPNCDKTCSQHCLVSEESDGSPCHHNNGTCLFGCQEGYTGSWCEGSHPNHFHFNHTSSEGRNDTAAVVAFTVVFVLVLLVGTLCAVYIKCCTGTRPKRWQSLVKVTVPQMTKVAARDVEQIQTLMEETQEMTIQKLKIDNTKLTEEINKSKHENVKLTDEINEFIQEIAKLKDEINQARDKIESLTIEARTAKQGNATLADKINKKDQENDELRENIHKAKQQIATLTDRNDQEMAKMTLKIKKNSQEIAKLTDEINQKDQDIATFTKKNRDLEDELTTLKKKKETANPDVDLGVQRKGAKENFKFSDEKMKEIRKLFVDNIDPNNIMSFFNVHSVNVLASQDIDFIKNTTSINGRLLGASELWDSLVKHNDWYYYLLIALRDPKIKQDHLADKMEDVAGGSGDL